MPIIPYDTESKSRNADFISIARRAIRHLQRRRRCRPLSEANTTLLHNLRRSRHHHPLNLLNPGHRVAALRPSISHCKKRAYVINWYE